MGNKENNVSINFGWTGLLGVAFVVLKLCKVIDWSWWWVTAPFWGGFAFIMLMWIVIFVIKVLVD